jgi:mitogen-activated protein kinase kinase
LQAIVEGDPPDLPSDGYSDAARNFVSGCLHKIPNLRPTYAKLLQHAWLAPLVKPTTIVEEDEDEEAMEAAEEVKSESATDVVDREVAEWVKQALEKRKLGKLGKNVKPALHAAPLNAVATPENVPNKADVQKQMIRDTEDKQSATETVTAELENKEPVGA